MAAYQHDTALTAYFHSLSAPQCNPLTREVEQALVLQMIQGDVLAKQTLISANLRLVVKLARGFFLNPGVDPMDVIQEGNKGLIVGVSRYDPEACAGARVTTYAGWWVRAFISQFVSNCWEWTTKTRDYQGDDILYPDSKIVPPAIIDDFNAAPAAPDDLAEQAEIAAFLRGWVNDTKVLSCTQRRVILERYLAEVPSSIPSIAKTMGISRQRAFQIMEAALVKLRKHGKSTGIMAELG